jgi:hypothetical protein
MLIGTTNKKGFLREGEGALSALRRFSEMSMRQRH